MQHRTLMKIHEDVKPGLEQQCGGQEFNMTLIIWSNSALPALRSQPLQETTHLNRTTTIPMAAIHPQRYKLPSGGRLLLSVSRGGEAHQHQCYPCLKVLVLLIWDSRNRSQ